MPATELLFNLNVICSLADDGETMAENETGLFLNGIAMVVNIAAHTAFALQHYMDFVFVAAFYCKICMNLDPCYTPRNL